jgi:hypothetical protein
MYIGRKINPIKIQTDLAHFTHKIYLYKFSYQEKEHCM